MLQFLTKLFEEGLSYSSLNSARAALSSFAVIPNGEGTIGSHALVARFMRGVFNLKPPLPRYEEIWDVKPVLNLLRSWSPCKVLSLKKLTIKLVVLLALVTAQRVQTLQLLSIENMKCHNEKVVFFITDLLKQSRPGHLGATIELFGYPTDRKLCVRTVLKHYLRQTDQVRGEEKQLLLTFRKPEKKASRATIARWIRFGLKAAGVDVSRYHAHSTRAASVSTAVRSQVDVNEILKKAGWAREATFQKFYSKPVLHQKDDSFSQAVLNSS